MKNHAATDRIINAMRALDPYVSRPQMLALVAGCRGEESGFFHERVVTMADRIAAMPKIYETCGDGAETEVVLHYFLSGFDWYIVEKDMTKEQLQAFGFVVEAGSGCGLQFGYISIKEITTLRAELDLHFKPCSLAALKAKIL